MEKNVIQITGGITINVNVSVKKLMYVKKKYVRNSSKCICENRKYLASIMLEPNILLFQWYQNREFWCE